MTTDKLLPLGATVLPQQCTTGRPHSRLSAGVAGHARRACPARQWTIASGLQFFDEFAHAATGIGRPFELRDVSAVGDELHRSPRDVPPEVVSAGGGQE